jgi:thioester reductase-like protein
MDNLDRPPLRQRSDSPPTTPPSSARAADGAPTVLLLTGATGLLGQSITYQALHSRAVDKIYLLVRPKRGLGAKERMAPSLLGLDEAFGGGRVRRSVEVVSASMQGDDLGLSPDDRCKIAAEVTHIVHAAASVRFDETPAAALRSNVTLAQRVMDLGGRCPRLKHHVHVSTAYVHPPGNEVNPSALVALPEGVDAAQLPPDADSDPHGAAAAALYQSSAGHHVNTYTWSKCIAEHVVTRRAARGGAQLTIVRPSIIGPAWKAPYPGWVTDTASPAVGASMLFGCGLLRAVYTMNVRQNIVPVDWVAADVLECLRTSEKCPAFVHAVVRHEDENFDHVSTFQTITDVFKDATDVQYRTPAPVLHTSWWRYLVHATCAEDSHLAFFSLVSRSTAKVLRVAIVQRNTILRKFGTRGVSVFGTRHAILTEICLC